MTILTGGRVFAQTFIFIDETGAKAASGFKFIKNSKNDVSFSSPAPMNKFYFRQSLSFEEPEASGYSFQSESYSIDPSKTGGDTLAILEGKKAAPSYSVNVIYLKGKNNAAAPSGGALKAYGFGGNLSAKTYTVNPQTVKTIPARTFTSLSNKPGTFGTNPNSQTASTKTVKPATTTVTDPAMVKPVAATVAGVKTFKPAVTTITAQPAVSNKNANTKKSVSLNLGAGGGSVSGVFTNPRGEPFPAESVVITVSNGSGTFTKSAVVQTSGGQTAYPFQIDGIPQILQGSSDSYKLTVVSNNSYTVSAALPSNIKIYGNGQNIYTQPITMAANRGRLNITLYHGQNAPLESDSMLLTLAQNAVMNIPGFALSCRFTGESPRHFYRYVIDDAPAGRWQMQIMFPGHGVSRQPSVWIPSNATISDMFDLTETR